MRGDGSDFWCSRGKSFANAGRGISLVLSTQRNAKLHFVATILVLGAGLLFQVTSLEWMILVFAMGWVWSAEAFNTALEFLADAVSQEPHPLIGQAKDMAAGAVLISALAAAIVGILLFGPYFLDFLR